MSEHDDPVLASREDSPWISAKVEEFFAAAGMALICLITFGNVIVRYFTDESFAFTEEFSVFLMVFMTFVGASAAFVRNAHIRVTFVTDRLGPVAAHALELLVMALGVLLFALIAWLGTRLAYDEWKFETTSPGIGIPQWLYTVWLPILSCVIVLRLLGRMHRLWRKGVR